MMVPFVRTPNDVYRGDVGFFLTPMIGRWKVAFNSGCVTWALLYLRPWNTAQKYHTKCKIYNNVKKKINNINY